MSEWPMVSAPPNKIKLSANITTVNIFDIFPSYIVTILSIMKRDRKLPPRIVIVLASSAPLISVEIAKR